MAAGREVWTIEGISREGMTEPQRALAEAGGSQCGYCTPGFAMSLFAEFYRPDRTSACDPLSMGGNLCRCTGYRPIRDAALSLGAAPDDGFRRLLSKPMAALPATKTEGWARPDTLRGVLEELAVPGAVAVAGATDVAVESNLKYRRWPHLVSLEAAPELREFADAGASVELGAALSLAELERLWRTAPAAWHEWLELFASPLVRNRATLGGNLATASPVGDGAPLLLALDARLRLAGPGGECDVPLHEFFTGYRTTVLRPGEIIRSVIVPKPFPRRIEFHKVAKRRLDDISTVAAAFAQLNDGSVRLAFGGMAATPVRVRPAEELLASRGWGAEAVRQARQVIAEEMKPLSDHRGSADYRRAVAANLLTKFALHEASA